MFQTFCVLSYRNSNAEKILCQIIFIKRWTITFSTSEMTRGATKSSQKLDLTTQKMKYEFTEEIQVNVFEEKHVLNARLLNSIEKIDKTVCHRLTNGG